MVIAMVKKLFYIVFSALFLLQTLTLPISVPELVLCVAEDHVQLEMKNTPSECTHDDLSSSTFDVLKQHYHTDNCADVPLFQHAQHVLSKNHSIHFAQSQAVVFLPNAKEISLKTSFLPITAPSSFVLQRTLRTVILLI